jgi:hypothetical protein
MARRANSGSHVALVHCLSVVSHDAYLAVGVILEVRVCQVLNEYTRVAASLTSGFDLQLTGF